jgi:hypothetical protein
VHPLLTHPRWLLAYLGAWTLLSVLPAAALGPWDTGHGVQAAAIAVLPTLAFALAVLPTWYALWAFPLDRSGLLRLATFHGIAAAVGGALWLGLAEAAARAAGLVPGWEDAVQRLAGRRLELAATGAVFWFLVAAFHYLLAAMEAVREAQARAAVLDVRAREAALAGLKAQVHPHFLFNSLNTISSMVVRDPAGARQTCIQLADFLRQSLRTPDARPIPLSEELALARAYLGVEAVRLGPRLAVRESVEPGCEAVPVLPLVLQPLVENAIRHGIARIPEGGTLALDAWRDGGALWLRVTNPVDPGSPAAAGGGMGLRTLRDRLGAMYPRGAVLDARRTGDTFQVAVRLPLDDGGTDA